MTPPDRLEPAVVGLRQTSRPAELPSLRRLLFRFLDFRIVFLRRVRGRLLLRLRVSFDVFVMRGFGISARLLSR
ncbi:hypothetical protein [Methylobacterium thuringiense]|uniref:hypothetical protein n=1 Tax=Methylobacterium thuringiense TaxID=1003091 RepID=UPI001EE096D4|nr:hypothetical protein [Methylobacterium thuringiense]